MTGSLRSNLGCAVVMGAAPAAFTGSMSPVYGPKRARVGDMVIAEGSRWLVVGIDAARHEAIRRLVGGSRVLRRFRARRILWVERRPRGAQ
jgi:hypothetical protein